MLSLVNACDQDNAYESETRRYQVFTRCYGRTSRAALV
ncbi:MAG: hypothetical protein AVDCRST_MAG68-3985 [uncultured Gemmatimonadetes bacterium]|uniref:Uncharacterized protein n=1 Tax=uncultured Gemmatimonadota bacterium TaxID=203437 RepID=A0A6J4M385_9BACT|nr:MAG: hypothetical protein AVDCRST_MAG68-3985 [uncultured Gemmatimonadota bacterium]